MRNVLLSIAALSLMLASCSSSDKAKEEHNNLYFFTDYENYLGFGKSLNIQKGEAFSGKCYSKADSSKAFSAGFEMALGDISTKKLKKLDVSCQGWLSDSDCEASLVIVIQRGDSAIKWDGFSLKEKLKEYKSWGEMKVTLPLPQNLDKNDVMKIYLWNTNNKGEARIDDLSIQFYE